VSKRAHFEVQFRRRIHATATLNDALRYNTSTIYFSPAWIDRMVIPEKESYREYTPGCVVVGDWD